MHFTMMPIKQANQRIPEIVEQVPPIRNLHCGGGPGRGALGVGARAVPANTCTCAQVQV